MLNPLVFILLLGIIFALDEDQCDCGNGKRNKIIGGDQVRPNEFPWHVALTYNGKYRCGGSLINEKYVLTAAHCLVHSESKLMKIVAGVHNLTDPKEKGVSYHQVKTIKTHKGFSDVLLTNDIGLLELEEEVVFTAKKRPICLPEVGESYKGKIFTVIGWGGYKENSYEISTVLRKTTLKEEGNMRCLVTYFRFVFSTQICAGYADEGRAACKGDSGGPLMIEKDNHWHIAGIVSYGHGCDVKRDPGVYTKVNKYLNWIEHNTAGTKICNMNSLYKK